jgi:hypothetical protein
MTRFEEFRSEQSRPEQFRSEASLPGNGPAAMPAAMPAAAPAASAVPAESPADWRELIPEDVRAERFWDKYADLPAALKGMAEAQRLIGRREAGVRVPGPFASDEEMRAFYAELGRPEGPDGYELPMLELPGGLEPDATVLGAFREKAHSLGLTATQARGLYEWFVPHQAELAHQAELDREAERLAEFAALREAHGAEAPRTLARAREAALAVGGPELLEVLARTGAGNSARVIDAFATIAPLVAEPGLRGEGSGSGGLTHEQLRAMRRDPRYSDPSRRDPDYVRQVETAYARMFPGAIQGPATAAR